MTPTRTMKAAAETRNSCIDCAVLSSAKRAPAVYALLSSGEQCPGRLTRFPVGGQHLRNGGGMRLRRGCEHSFNCTRDAHKGDTTVEECLHGHLVGRIQGDAVRSAFFRRLKGQAQAGEALEVGLLEIQMPQRGQVEGERGGRPLRLGQRVEDGQPHVGD